MGIIISMCCTITLFIMLAVCCLMRDCTTKSDLEAEVQARLHYGSLARDPGN